MKISKKDLKHMAKLSRITLTEEELDKFTPQMQTILDSVKTLDEIDVKGVVLEARRKTTINDLREDVSKPSMSQEKVLQNAKLTKDGMIMVPGSTVENIDS